MSWSTARPSDSAATCASTPMPSVRATLFAVPVGMMPIGTPVPASRFATLLRCRRRPRRPSRRLGSSARRPLPSCRRSAPSTRTPRASRPAPCSRGCSVACVGVVDERGTHARATACTARASAAPLLVANVQRREHAHPRDQRRRHLQPRAPRAGRGRFALRRGARRRARHRAVLDGAGGDGDAPAPSSPGAHRRLRGVQGRRHARRLRRARRVRVGARRRRVLGGEHRAQRRQCDVALGDAGRGEAGRAPRPPRHRVQRARGRGHDRLRADPAVCRARRARSPRAAVAPPSQRELPLRAARRALDAAVTCVTTTAA